MVATGTRRGGLIYHWKHGWIPLDHFAALSKGHHRRTEAVKVMEKHGIEVPHGYLGAGHHGPPKAPAHVEASISRAHVTHSGDGTLLSIDRNDAEARDAAKAAGFRWSRNLGSWYLPRNQTESTRRFKVSQLEAKLGKEHVHVEDAGHSKTTTAAEREATRKAASAARAERLDARTEKHLAERDARYKAAHDIADRIPMGQPILVGHHSERGHRADIKRIHSHSDKMVEAQHKADYTQRLAEAARKNASAPDSPLLRQRRIDRNEAEIRSIDRKLTEHSIALKAPQSAAKVGIKPLSADYHAKLTAQRAELADQVAHDRTQIEASGFKGVNPVNVQAGDMIQYRGRTHIVAKVNKTTFSVPTPYSWEDKVPVNQATKHIPLSTQSASAIENAYKSATNPHVKAALAKELKKRGLQIPAA